MTAPTRPSGLSPQHRTAALRAEIAHAEAKLQRLRTAIQHRKQILHRLEAATVLNGAPAPDHADDE